MTDLPNESSETRRIAEARRKAPGSAKSFRALTKRLPRRLIVQSLVLQSMIGAPFVLYFALLTLGYYPEPQSHVALEDRSPGERIAIMHLWIALFSAASMFSCVGSLVSHLSRLNSADVDVENESFLLSLHVLGTIFGIVILLLFLGGFVQGELFPDFRGAGFLSLHTQFSSVDGWAKLLIWTFVAGFSERLVPDLLMNISRKLPDSTVDENSA